MFSQQEFYYGMERNCYCCRPGPSLPTIAPTPYLMEPHSSSMQGTSLSLPKFRQETSIMDVDSALSELDDLQLVTSTLRPKSAGGSDNVQDQRPERKVRVRSLSESMAGPAHDPTHSKSESSLHSTAEIGNRISHHRKVCSMGNKMIGCSLSLPRKMCGYQMVQRNAAFVSDISASWVCSSLQHLTTLPARWASAENSYSEQSSTDSTPPSMGVYRDSDLLDERSKQRRMARVRFDRSRRLRQPYSIPFRMFQSMSEDSTASLNDFLTEVGSSRGSKSSTVSPAKPDFENIPAGSLGFGTLVRSRSIDNLELAKLRLTDALDAKTENSDVEQTVEIEQVVSDLKNLQMV